MIGPLPFGAWLAALIVCGLALGWWATQDGKPDPGPKDIDGDPEK